MVSIGRPTSQPPLCQPWIKMVEGSCPLRVTFVEPQGERPDEMPHVAIGLPPGLNEDAKIQHPFARRLVRAAWRAGEWATVAAYDMPHIGPDSYDYQFKTRRWITAAQAITDELEMPLDVVAHSQAWACAVDTGPELVEAGRIRTITGINPAHHRNLRAHRRLDVGITTARMLGELFSLQRLGTRRGGAYSIARLSAVTLTHVLHDFWGAVSEADAILCADSSLAAAELSRNPTVGMAVGVGVHDKITPAFESLAKLQAAGFAGPVAVWRTDHVGVIANRSLAQEVYNLSVRARGNLNV